jgi:hypothetical protein
MLPALAQASAGAVPKGGLDSAAAPPAPAAPAGRGAVAAEIGRERLRRIPARRTQVRRVSCRLSDPSLVLRRCFQMGRRGLAAAHSPRLLARAPMSGLMQPEQRVMVGASWRRAVSRRSSGDQLLGGASTPEKTSTASERPGTSSSWIFLASSLGAIAVVLKLVLKQITVPAPSAGTGSR